MTYVTRVLILACLLIGAAPVLAQTTLFIESGKDDYPLSRHISILEDKEHSLSIHEAASDSIKNKFVNLSAESPNLGFNKSAFWIRFEIADTLQNSPNNRTWLLVNNEPLLKDIRLYYRDPGAGSSEFIEKRSGMIVPLKDKELQTVAFVANLPVKKNTANTFYLRVSTVTQVILSFTILTPERNFARSMMKFLFHGFLFGILFLIIIYNTFLYFAIKQTTFLFYVLYVFAYTFLMFNYEGYFFRFISATFIQGYFLVPMVTGASIGLFWLLLTRDFLSTKIFLPSAYTLLNYLSAVAALFIVSTAVWPSPAMAAINNIGAMLFFILGMVIAIITWVRGNKISKFYILALSGAVIGLTVIVMRRNGFLPLNFWTENALNLGVLWEAMILSYTVGYRFNLLNAEKEKEKEMMRNQIAADLHDEVGSNLSTISLQSQLMMKNRRLDGDSKEQLHDIAKTASTTTDTIRDIVWFINPFHDNSEELVLRMKELASKMLSNGKYSFDSGLTDGRIFDSVPDLRKRRHIYFIYKETLNNIMKHSQADTVGISLSLKNNEFIMTVSDNGKGFDEAVVHKGQGLKNLRTRAELMNAKILIEREAAGGTKVILTVPLN